MNILAKIKDNLKDNLIANIILAAGAVAAIVTLFTYPAAIDGTTAYFAPVTVLTVFGFVLLLVSALCSFKGYVPLVGILLVGLAFGFFLSSRMEDFGLLQVGIGTFGSMSAYVATIVFYGISLVASVVGTFLIKRG